MTLRTMPVDLPEIRKGDHRGFVLELERRGFHFAWRPESSEAELEVPTMHPLLHHAWWQSFLLTMQYVGEKDVYRVLAAHAHTKLVDAVTDSERATMKGLLFATMYGSPFQLPYHIGELVVGYVTTHLKNAANALTSALENDA